ncbi:DUF7661 family protein [Pseudomonas sp. RIT-To-2]|uniref:DUF7661 family protein n=1 Tax=Pseudomonas sp. RIT-To-2 TaxID=3462541 RepID=UPI00241353C6
MMIYDVFGTLLGVRKSGEHWQVFRVDTGEGKHSRMHEVVIPDFVTEGEIAGWLDDIYHESARGAHREVKRLQ